MYASHLISGRPCPVSSGAISSGDIGSSARICHRTGCCHRYGGSKDRRRYQAEKRVANYWHTLVPPKLVETQARLIPRMSYATPARGHRGHQKPRATRSALEAPRTAEIANPDEPRRCRVLSDVTTIHYVVMIKFPLSPEARALPEFYFCNNVEGQKCVSTYRLVIAHLSQSSTHPTSTARHDDEVLNHSRLHPHCVKFKAHLRQCLRHKRRRCSYANAVSNAVRPTAIYPFNERNGSFASSCAAERMSVILPLSDRVVRIIMRINGTRRRRAGFSTRQRGSRSRVPACLSLFERAPRTNADVPPLLGDRRDGELPLFRAQ